LLSSCCLNCIGKPSLYSFFFFDITFFAGTLRDVRRSARNERRFYDQLDGLWTFVREETNSPSIGLLRKWHLYDLSLFENATVMPVPSAYNELTADRQVREHVGWVWYQRKVIVSARDKPYRHFLRFSSVNYQAFVFLNDKIVGIHIGGHLPFEFDVTTYILFDAENRITVAVNNTLSPRTIPPAGFYYVQKKYGERKQYADGFVLSSMVWSSSTTRTF
uniref:Glyco_hydro_2_N domain-containing protein n=1 Tax=Gongylonema pulchrum TaxID=637853 RepID=A0A183CX74_9BILA